LVDVAVLRQLVADAVHDGIAKVVVGMVVERDGRMLLLKRPMDDFMGGIWELPSGNVEPGERLDDAVRREMKEETALDVSSLQEYVGSFDYLSSTGRRTRQFTFAVDVVSHEPVRLQEHDSYQWAPVTGELPVTAAVNQLLRRYRPGP
jgi:8-oxo-dGTP diphosphatase